MDSPAKTPSPPHREPPLTHTLTDDDRVEQAGLGSFPASDPPPWTSGLEVVPRRNSDDPDGDDSRDRARRRRHIDA